MVPPVILRNSVILIVVFISVLNVLIFTARTKNADFMSKPSVLGQGVIDNFDKDVLHEASDEDANELDGCYHVFLDVGSNIGNQVRKYLR